MTSSNNNNNNNHHLKKPCNISTCKNEGSLRCSNCRTVCYCSAVCQKKHWPQHKLTCKTHVPFIDANRSKKKRRLHEPDKNGIHTRIDTKHLLDKWRANVEERKSKCTSVDEEKISRAPTSGTLLLLSSTTTPKKSKESSNVSPSTSTSTTPTTTTTTEIDSCALRIISPRNNKKPRVVSLELEEQPIRILVHPNKKNAKKKNNTKKNSKNTKEQKKKKEQVEKKKEQKEEEEEEEKGEQKNDDTKNDEEQVVKIITKTQRRKMMAQQEEKKQQELLVDTQSPPLTLSTLDNESKKGIVQSPTFVSFPAINLLLNNVELLNIALSNDHIQKFFAQTIRLIYSPTCTLSIDKSLPVVRPGIRFSAKSLPRLFIDTYRTMFPSRKASDYINSWFDTPVIE